MVKSFTALKTILAFALLLLFTSLKPAPFHHASVPDVTSACRPGEVIVMYSSMAGANQARGVTDGRLTEVFSKMGAREIRRLNHESSLTPDRSEFNSLLNRVSLLSFDTTRISSVDEAIAMLTTLDEVELAEPNLIVSIQPFCENSNLSSVEEHRQSKQSPFNLWTPVIKETQETTNLSDQWYLEAINMPQLWQQPVVNTKRPVVAIVDTGVDITHPDLKDNIAEGGYDFVTDTTIIFDANGHGTHCAGLVAAKGLVMKGANPDALIMPITVVDSLGSGGLMNILLGLVHAANNGADIISLSLGTYGTSSLYHTIVNAIADRCIILAAAGNEGFCMHSTHRDLHGMATPHLPCLPAAYETTIGVMATTEEGQLARWSNFDCNGPLRGVTQAGFVGWGYQLYVPGNHMLSTLPGGEYGIMSGTSMATPLAAGALSRLLQCRNFESRDEMVRTLIMTSHGHIDMMAALQATQESLHFGQFVEEIDGQPMTFVQTSDSTAQIGDGTTAAVLAAQIGTTMTVPNEVRGLSVTTLAPHAFEGCKSLQTVRLGCNVEEIGDAAFHDCTALQELAFATRFPPTATRNAFDSHHYQTVTLRNAKGYEENYAKNFQTQTPWSNFSRWEELDLTTGNRFWETVDAQGTRMSFIIYNVKSNIAQVGDGEVCIDTLRSGHLTIPDKARGLDVLAIAEEAFHNCKLLTSVTMPKYLSNIWYNAFAGCTGLRQVELPNSVTYIGGRAFEDCSNMQTLKLSSRIDEIGNYAFVGCTALTSIVIPRATPPYIDENIFLARSPLFTGVYSLDGSDGSIYRNATLYVPYGCRERYAKAPGWRNFRHIEEMATEDITTLNDPASNLNSQFIYDLQGRKIENRESFDQSLIRGVYIVGKKKIIK